MPPKSKSAASHSPRGRLSRMTGRTYIVSGVEINALSGAALGRHPGCRLGRCEVWCCRADARSYVEYAHRVPEQSKIPCQRASSGIDGYVTVTTPRNGRTNGDRARDLETLSAPLDASPLLGASSNSHCIDRTSGQRSSPVFAVITRFQ
jgi:hypothetical protein